MHARIALVLLLAACSVAACSARDARVAESAQGLKIASWNLEHLAEQDGLGCRPRTESDYAALRAYAKRLDADVVAFQEVESAAAAARVFPSAEYSVVISTRPPSGRQHFCGRDATDGPLIREQKVGFAIRHGVEFKRNADFSALGLDNADLRWGVDITLQGEHPLRLLAVHLKSGCSAGSDREACPVLFEQVPVLDQWIEARQREGEAFAILGDFNRRLALPGDSVWKALEEDVDLTDASGGEPARCQQRYPDFIDHIVLNPGAASRVVAGSFEQFDYGVSEAEHPSDHCPIAVRLGQ